MLCKFHFEINSSTVEVGQYYISLLKLYSLLTHTGPPVASAQWYSTNSTDIVKVSPAGLLSSGERFKTSGSVPGSWTEDLRVVGESSWSGNLFNSVLDSGRTPTS